MLHFLRTHQRILFFFLAIIIIISFAFFGTYGTFVTPPTANDEVVHKTSTGQEVTRGELEHLKRFVASDADVLPSANRFPNYLHDGLFSRQLVNSGAIVELAHRHFSDEMENKLALEKAWTPYVHSDNQAISAVNVWKVFAPAIPANLQKLKQSTDLKEQLQARFALMEAEKAFPDAYLNQFIRWQQDKEASLTKEDPGPLALFGYKDMADWVGPKLYDKMIYTLLEAASHAKAQGITVSDEEAAAYLRTASEAGRQKAEVLQLNFLALQSPQTFYEQQLQIMHMTEADAIEAVKPLLLTEKLLERASNALFVDALTLNYVGDSAKTNVKVQIYEMDPSLQFTKANELYLFESYLEKVAAKKGEMALASPAEVKKRAPELVEQSFSVEIKEVSIEDIALKDLWRWQLQEANWKKLEGRFGELLGAKSVDERAEKLDAMPPSQRLSIDHFSRADMMKQNPQLIDQLLDKAPAKKCDLMMRGKGVVNGPFKGMKDSTILAEKLESGSIKKITFDNSTFYAISRIKTEEPRILSFAEAKAVLPAADGKRFASLVTSLVSEAKKAGYTKEASETDGDFAARMRFLKQLQKERAAKNDLLAAEKEAALGLKNDPWALKKRVISLVEAKEEGLSLERVTATKDKLLFAVPLKEAAGEKVDTLAVAKEAARREAAIQLFTR